MLAPDEDAGACPSGDAVLLSLKAELNGGAFDPLRPTLERVLVDEGGLKTNLALISALVGELQGDEVRTLLSVLSSDEGSSTVNAFKPHLINVLEYLHGSSPFIAGKHDLPLIAAHDILTSCDAAEQMGTLRALLALEVKRAPAGAPSAFVIAAPGEGDSSFLFAMMTSIDAAAEIPEMRALLERIEIEEDGSGTSGNDIVVGRAAFLVLAKLLAENISAPDFDINATRGVLEDVLLAQLDTPEAEAALDELLDLLGLLVEADSTTFEGVQAFMGCVNRHDEDAAIPGMLFDYMTIDELPLQELLDDVVTSANGETADDLRVALIAILDAVIRHPDLLADTTNVLAKLIDPNVAETTLDTVLSLKGKGVLTELQEFLGVLLTCKEVPL